MKSIKKIDLNDILIYNFYINLDKRPDRKQDIEIELKKFGIINPIRFKGIENNIGSIGCCESHIKILEKAKESNYPCVFIFEDDVKFLDHKETYNKLDRILNSGLGWDVILLGGNNYKPYTKISDDIVKVNNCQSRASYLVNSNYYDKLLQNFKEGLVNMKKSIKNHMLMNKLSSTDFKGERKYRGDQCWKELQKKDNWYLIIPLKVIQKPSMSDIEKKPVNYKHVMMSLS